MHAKLVRFRPRKHLIDREQAVEAAARQPALFVDQFPANHRDLRYRAAPGKQSEAQEAEEDLARRLLRWCV